ncbi:hypothetical protein ABPG72_006120 [Tetrahymena utriculariae]
MNIQEKEISHKGLTFVPYIQREKIAQEVKRVAQEISQDYKDKNPIFIGILNGAFIFCSDLIRNLEFLEQQVEFCKVSSYEGTESSGNIKQLIGLKYEIKDRHIIIVEDIVDSGVTMQGLINFLKEKNPASIKLCTMFFKPANLKVELKVDYVGMTIDPEFIIGYGLDFDEWGRNIPDVWILKKEQN